MLRASSFGGRCPIVRAVHRAGCFGGAASRAPRRPVCARARFPLFFRGREAGSLGAVRVGGASRFASGGSGSKCTAAVPIRLSTRIERARRHGRRRSTEAKATASTRTPIDHSCMGCLAGSTHESIRAPSRRETPEIKGPRRRALGNEKTGRARKLETGRRKRARLGRPVVRFGAEERNRCPSGLSCGVRRCRLREQTVNASGPGLCIRKRRASSSRCRASGEAGEPIRPAGAILPREYAAQRRFCLLKHRRGAPLGPGGARCPITCPYRTPDRGRFWGGVPRRCFCRRKRRDGLINR